MNLEKLEKSIGYTFKDKRLLRQALTHTSYAYENKVESNEKLEFLGDSILEFISSKYIYNRNEPDRSIDILDEVSAKVSLKESKDLKEYGTYNKKLKEVIKNKKKAIIDN